MNQLTTQDQVKNLIQIRKSLARGKAGKLADNQAFLDFLSIQQQMTAEFDKTWEVIREQMEQYGITKIDGEWGHIQFVPYPTYSAESHVAPRYFKQVLDGKKIKAHMALHDGRVPNGVAVKITQQFKKHIKAV